MIKNRVLGITIGILCVFNLSAAPKIEGSETVELNGNCSNLCTSYSKDSYNNTISTRISSVFIDPQETYTGSNKFVCIPCECGDGEKQEYEACDDGNNKGLDGCTADCGTVEYCGDEIVNTPSETCDKGEFNGTPGSVCSKDCKIDICLGFPEEIELLCGNDKKECNEECDEGDDNGLIGSGCTRKCIIDKCLKTPEQVKLLCGNGIKDCNEECDAGNGNGTPGTNCNKECKIDKCFDTSENIKLLCGNGIKDCDEECDDENLTNGDGCDSQCKEEDVCAGVYPYSPGKICLKGRFITNASVNGYFWNLIYDSNNSAKTDKISGANYARYFEVYVLTMINNYYGFAFVDPNAIPANYYQGEISNGDYYFWGLEHIYSTKKPNIVCYTCSHNRMINGGCFDPETKIQLADGKEIPVKDLSVGVELINPKTGKNVKLRSIVESYEAQELVEVYFEDRVLKVTITHPMVTNRGIIPANQLKEDDLLYKLDGSSVKINQIKKSDKNSKRKVINLVLDTDSDEYNEHILISEGIQTGDYIAQQKLVGK